MHFASYVAYFANVFCIFATGPISGLLKHSEIIDTIDTNDTHILFYFVGLF